jgi:CRISPR type III-A-associated RAMP protein Csm4
MNPGLVVKLRPAGPWRIGPDSGARNRVDVIYHSDSLYSAVTSAMSRMGSLEAWLDATARSQTPAVCFSSCFPFLDDIGFVVPPRTIWPPTSPAAMSARVRWKSARFIPLGVVESILSGRKLNENQWSVDGPSGCLVPAGKPGPFRTSVRWNAAVDRLTGACERHATACIEFREGCGLWTVVGFHDEAARDQWQEPVKAAFRLLADTGFGGERSRGWGRSETPEFVEGTLPGLIIEYKQKAPSTATPVEEPPAEESPITEPPPAEEPVSAPEPPVDGEPVPQAEAGQPASETVLSEVDPAGLDIAPAGPEAAVEPEPAVAEPEVAAKLEAIAAEAEAVTPVPESVAAEPAAVTSEPEAIAAEPEAVTPVPESVAAEPAAVTSEPEAIAAEPDAVTPEPDAVAATAEPAPEAEAAVPEAADVPVAESPEPAVAAAVPDQPPAESVSEAEVAPEPALSDAPTAAALRAPDLTEPMRVAAEPAAAPVVPAPPAHLQAHWLLSLFTPAASDAVDWGRGSYAVLARGGRIDSPAPGSGDLKKQIQMVAEGSVLYADGAPLGAAADVAPDGFAHPVFRAGFALAIPLPEVH